MGNPVDQDLDTLELGTVLVHPDIGISLSLIRTSLELRNTMRHRSNEGVHCSVK